ncbi:hypothetical protein JFK97_05520 [Chromobacterium phragmitis]|uniref:Cystatin domain-containing protein n=1 Tax=Chromobacterium amazonense TaxID=1382803 RepID=A0A2S9X6A7_9NEIS|nr:hypothetical protein [Chromobacterium amazonense]MBM2883842.1 hypothetical protein [Chromobacterium amazonense]MDE1716045.1 hypothetical protein [Chromobacterium amazonense]PRP71217.1 hypothetical protein BUE93_08410 [Chromobacterium amazonense]
MSEQVPGGWSGFKPLNEHDRKVFHQATEGLLGVKYAPLAVSTQIVAGENFIFLASAEVIYPGALPHLVAVYIFQPLGDKPPHVTRVENISL